MEIPDHVTCLLRNLYAGQEGTVWTEHETMDLFKIGKALHRGYILSPCFFNFYAELIMWNAGLDDSQSGIKIARMNINFRYANDITLMAESEEELKSLLMRGKKGVKKAGLKLSIQKAKIMVSGPITSWQIDGGKKWKQWQILFSWAPKPLWTVIAAMKLKDAASLEENLWKT